MSGEISSLAKTSLTLLNELSFSSGKKAEFNFLETKGVGNCMAFRVRAKLGEYEAIGQGKSKKEAKQHAAEQLLPQVKFLQRVSSKPVEQEENEHAVLRTMNAVGWLQEKCQETDLSHPNYIFLYGTFSSKVLKYHCMCEMGNHRTMGEALSKRNAKREAAENMVKIFEIYSNSPNITKCPSLTAGDELE